MRLLEVFRSESEVFVFCEFLKREGITVTYELQSPHHYALWIHDEDDLERATEWLSQYQKNPQDPLFLQPADRPHLTAVSIPLSIEKTSRLRLKLTHCILILCIFLFLVEDFQEDTILATSGKLGQEWILSPLQYALLFDISQAQQCRQELLKEASLKEYHNAQSLPDSLKTQLAAADKIPSWQGILPFFASVRKVGWDAAKRVPMWEKIKEGQVWRIFTPCLLHADFLHIFFNMAWVWILMPQIEERLKWGRLLLLIFLVGAIANLFQYLIGGPYFVGFSGVVVGMVAFIWMRQKKAPWEGYPLHRSTILFLFFFILAMVGLEVIAAVLQSLSLGSHPFKIANTAHIIGGLIGLLLGSTSFFARRRS